MSPKVSAKRRDTYLREQREKILQAAIREFSEKGYERTNVADIAQAAGIGKGTVYLYFKRKDDILSAVLAERSLMSSLSSVMVESGDLTVTLTDIAVNFLSTMSDLLPVFRLVLTDAHRFPASAEHLYRDMVLQADVKLANILKDHMKLHHIRKLDDPLLTARAFIGMLMIYPLSQEMLGGKSVSPIEREDWAREVVRLFLQGVRPEPEREAAHAASPVH